MKTFDFMIDNIFSGLTSDEKDNKADIKMAEYHNIVPLGNNYDIHESINDLNDAISFGGAGEFLTDIWEDHSDDLWVDSDSDIFEDS